jgi:hypothetical protein
MIDTIGYYNIILYLRELAFTVKHLEDVVNSYGHANR